MVWGSCMASWRTLTVSSREENYCCGFSIWGGAIALLQPLPPRNLTLHRCLPVEVLGLQSRSLLGSPSVGSHSTNRWNQRLGDWEPRWHFGVSMLAGSGKSLSFARRLFCHQCSYARGRLLIRTTFKNGNKLSSSVFFILKKIKFFLKFR